MTEIILPKLTFHPSPNVSSRHGENVHLIVVHRPVGSYASAITTLCDPASKASAHIVQKRGGLEATQLVPWDSKAWACKAFNAFSDNLEINDEVWTMDDPHGFKVAARIVAQRCKVRKINPVWTQNPMTHPGICRHYDLGHIGGGHTDPTTNRNVWLAFEAEVVRQYERGGFDLTWGT